MQLVYSKLERKYKNSLLYIFFQQQEQTNKRSRHNFLSHIMMLKEIREFW